ncbi:MAG TPA: TonB-dependent receptor [Pyrinomonadaceae bacterium]|nr:TonB-dependent receptor [Pyrinomonadaceae bacterium]
MRAFPLRWLPTASRFVLACAAALALSAGAAFAQADSTSATLNGFVRDPQGAAVPGASVTARNPATGETRTTTTNDEGYYQLVQLTPGALELVVEAANFKRAVVPNVVVTVGQRADLDIPLELGGVGETITVTGATTELIETTRTNVSNTIDQVRIDNLPINQRDYINFTLTTSTVTRDNGRPIGPAPTSGLNFGGQRGRSNLVQVDGADNTDNSVNAARSTVSQEAVQEFQVVTNSFAPEFGRTAGGVVNVVTKSGTNEVRGNVFGFIRHKSIQARNAFAPVINNDPDEKPPFTRAQYGATLGFPLDRDRTFGFIAFEQRRRQESGFFTSDVTAGLGGSVTIGAPFLPFTQTFNRLTPQQAGYVTSLLGRAAQLAGAGQAAAAQAVAGAAIGYATLASSGGQIGLGGRSTLISPGGTLGVPAGQVIGQRFVLTGAPVPVNPNAFRPLNDLARVFPISEATSFYSARLDHQITSNNQLALRFGYNPSDITGIQVESQNQALGQNDFSRTGIQTLRDATFVATLHSTLSDTVVNEARFNFGQRRATFTSQNGQGTAYNISGTAFIGRELFSPVIRTENRFQYADNVTWVAGNHNFKFGGDANFIAVDAIFELNFAGLFNFGGLTAQTLNPNFPNPSNPAAPGRPCQGATDTDCVPSLTPVQQYGLGFPGNFIQGFGNPVSALKNRPLAVFAQDSWKIHPRLTFNYGVRYDYEITDELEVQDFRDPLSGIVVPAATTQSFYNAFGIQQGFPRDKNNVAPRFGFAWDIFGNANTVLRGAFGLFYDHPLLAIGFNSDIADNVQQQQFIALPGSPAPTALLNAVQIFQGTVCTGQPGNPLCPPAFRTPGVAAGTNYQFGRQRFDDQTFPGFGPFLPFSLPVSTDFEYAYANQANVTVEQKLGENMSFSASWLFTGAHHLPHPTNLNAPNNTALIENFRRCTGALPTTTTSVITLNPATCANVVAAPIPGLVVVTTRGTVVQPFVANLFRPSGPNYLFTRSVTGGAVSPAVLNAVLSATNALTRPNLVTTFGDINAQVSDGNSVYHAGNFELRRRFANNFQFLASYTWSHSIDDSSDLQTLLLPQDVTRLDLERADSLFDQRHRFVFSGVLASPGGWRGAGGWRSLFADFIVAPIFEMSSGRPFNILTNQDTNNDLTGNTDRPSVAPDGTLIVPPQFQSGNLGRNAGLTRSYQSLDLRVARTIPFGERLRLEVIAEGFNLFNRFNEAAASPRFEDVNLINERAPNGRYRSRSTAAFDPRQFQFGLKLNF